MTSKRNGPGALAGAAGASETVHGTGRAEDTRPPAVAQIALLRFRWGLPPATAAAVAGLAWGGTA